MKKTIVIILLIAFCSFFVVPKAARAGGNVAESFIEGAAIGLVVYVIWWAVSSRTESPQKEDKSGQKEKPLEDSYFIPKTWSENLYFSKKYNKQVPFYSFKVEF